MTTSSRICLGDVVTLKDSRIGTVRFVGHTGFKNNILFYGIHLKQNDGDNDGTDIHNRRYFKCPPDHGIFAEKSEIKKIIKKHSVSASYSYNERIKVLNIGKGYIKYIGMTHFGNNYWFGIQLIHNIKRTKNHKSNDFIHYLKLNEKNVYFHGDYKNSIFVRSNQLRCINDTKMKNKKYGNKSNKKLKKKTQSISKENICLIENEDDDEYINKTLLAMMNSLNIPQNARIGMMKMDKTQKILLIKQWFITPNRPTLQNRNRSQSEPMTPSSTSNILTPSNKKDISSRNYSMNNEILNGFPDIIQNESKLNINPSKSNSNDSEFDESVVIKTKTKKKKTKPLTKNNRNSDKKSENKDIEKKRKKRNIEKKKQKKNDNKIESKSKAKSKTLQSKQRNGSNKKIETKKKKKKKTNSKSDKKASKQTKQTKQRQNKSTISNQRKKKKKKVKKCK